MAFYSAAALGSFRFWCWVQAAVSAFKWGVRRLFFVVLEERCKGVRGVGVLCSGHQKVSKEVRYQSHLCEQLQETDCEIFRPHRPQKS